MAIVLFLIAAALGWAGLAVLRDTLAQGETLISPFLLLAIPLLYVGNMLVKTVARVTPQLRNGHDRAKSLVAIPLAVVLGVGLYGLNRDIPLQRPDPAVTQAVGVACAGQAVALAGTLHTDGSEPNHLVVLDPEGAEQGWTGKPALTWRPPTVGDTELVACIDRAETNRVVEVCRYDHGSVTTRHDAKREIRVVAAHSGLELASFSIVSTPTECPFSKVGGDSDDIRADVSWEQVAEHLASLVRDGTFVDPDVPGPESAPIATMSTDSSTPPGALTAPLPTQAPAVELRAAIAAGSVAVTARGVNLQQLELVLTSRSGQPMRVVVNPATVFNPGSSSIQSMVVIAKRVITLEPDEEATVQLDVACADMKLDTPNGSNGFKLDANRPSGSLVRLFRVAAFGDVDFRIKQFAIWTITDNPTRSGYVGLGTFGVGSGPSKAELARIRALFIEAGIDPDRYRAL